MGGKKLKWIEQKWVISLKILSEVYALTADRSNESVFARIWLLCEFQGRLTEYEK